MQMNQLVAASSLAQRFGVKALAYGPPGTGKTPIAKTAPRPVMCVCEPGMLSMRDATNVPAWEAYTPERINEFFTWLLQSTEARNFDTVVLDSVSQMAEIFLAQELARWKDGRKAYGEMSRHSMDLINALYYLPNKHTYLIAKQGIVEEAGSNLRRPYFPGQDLNVKVPHLFDEILYIAEATIPGTMQPQIAIRTKSTFGILARDRSGKLAELEPPNLTQIFAKCMS